jgi:hypothetical protein
VEVQDIKTVLLLAKTGLQQTHLDPDSNDPAKRLRDQNKAIEAVETWLHEIGALPPR